MRTESYEISFPFFQKRKKKKVDIPPLRKTEGKKTKKLERLSRPKKKMKKPRVLSVWCAHHSAMYLGIFFWRVTDSGRLVHMRRNETPKTLCRRVHCEAYYRTKRCKPPPHHPLFSFFLKEEVTNRTFMRVRL